VIVDLRADARGFFLHTKLRRGIEHAANPLRSSGKFPNGAWHRPGRASGILPLNASDKIAGSIWICGTFQFDLVRVKNSRSLLSTKTWSTISSNAGLTE
jgi:hypothetical protein